MVWSRARSGSPRAMNVRMIELGRAVGAGLKPPCYVHLHVLRGVSRRRVLIRHVVPSLTSRTDARPSRLQAWPHARPCLTRRPHTRPSSFAGHVHAHPSGHAPTPGCPHMQATRPRQP